MTVPLPNSLMKMIRHCEVYLMEEAVTEKILRSTGNIILTGGRYSGNEKENTDLN